MTKQLSKGYWLSESFKEVFEGVTPSKKAPKMKFTKLTKITTDEEIIKTTGIMSKEDCLAALIEITKKKEPETMDGYVNIIGYVEHNGSVRFARAGWSSDDQKWCCYSYGLSHWDAGRRFWSRNDIQTSSPSDTQSLDSLTLWKNVSRNLKLLSKVLKDYFCRGMTKIICLIQTIISSLRGGWPFNYPISGHSYVEEEVHINCRVSVLKCERCGKCDISWSK